MSHLLTTTIVFTQKINLDLDQLVRQLSDVPLANHHTIFFTPEKKFLRYVPFLLRVASAPADMDAHTAEMTNSQGELQLEEDAELNLGQCAPTEEELAQEQADEPHKAV